jgi:hypothetical protein
MKETAMTLVSERQKRLRQAQLQMGEEMKRLLTEHRPEEGLTWKESRTDLMEAFYYVFDSGVMIDDYGMAITFADIVRRGCSLLHVQAPGNPYLMAMRGRQRKGMKHLNFLERYQLMMEKQPENTLWMSITWSIT